MKYKETKKDRQWKTRRKGRFEVERSCLVSCNDQSTNRPTDRPIDRPTDQSTHRPRRIYASSIGCLRAIYRYLSIPHRPRLAAVVPSYAPHISSFSPAPLQLPVAGGPDGDGAAASTPTPCFTPSKPVLLLLQLLLLFSSCRCCGRASACGCDELTLTLAPSGAAAVVLVPEDGGGDLSGPSPVASD